MLFVLGMIFASFECKHLNEEEDFDSPMEEIADSNDDCGYLMAPCENDGECCSENCTEGLCVAF